jgi:hypothetical protein
MRGEERHSRGPNVPSKSTKENIEHEIMKMMEKSSWT